MLKALNDDDDDATLDVDHGLEIEPNSALSEVVLLDPQDDLEEERGRAPAAEALEG